MSENLIAAKKALQIELQEAQKKVLSLQETIGMLDAIKGYISRPKQSKDISAKVTPGGTLPETGQDFWIDLIGKEPVGTKHLLARATNVLGLLSPTPEQTVKLRDRMYFYLKKFTDEKVIVSKGKGPARTYRKK